MKVGIFMVAEAILPRNAGDAGIYFFKKARRPYGGSEGLKAGGGPGPWPSLAVAQGPGPGRPGPGPWAPWALSTKLGNRKKET